MSYASKLEPPNAGSTRPFGQFLTARQYERLRPRLSSMFTRTIIAELNRLRLPPESRQGSGDDYAVFRGIFERCPRGESVVFSLREFESLTDGQRDFLLQFVKSGFGNKPPSIPEDLVSGNKQVFCPFEAAGLEHIAPATEKAEEAEIIARLKQVLEFRLKHGIRASYSNISRFILVEFPFNSELGSVKIQYFARSRIGLTNSELLSNQFGKKSPSSAASGMVARNPPAESTVPVGVFFRRLTELDGSADSSGRKLITREMLEILNEEFPHGVKNRGPLSESFINYCLDKIRRANHELRRAPSRDLL